MSCDNKQKSTEGEENIAGEISEEEKEAEETEHPGAAIYSQNCGTCHQSDGSGVSGLYPPVSDSDWIDGDKTRLINVILNGLSGPIEVNGESYNNAMPQFSYLNDEQIADLLTYLRQNFGNDADEITPREVAGVRETGVE